MICEIKTDKAPEALGPYSQGVEVNGFIYTAGQIALDPASGEMIPGGITEQTHRVLENLQAVLAAAGSSLEKAVKCTVFLQDMNDFAAMNSVYAEYFSSPFPARAAVQAVRLPKDALVEIDAVAVK